MDFLPNHGFKEIHIFIFIHFMKIDISIFFLEQQLRQHFKVKVVVGIDSFD